MKTKIFVSIEQETVEALEQALLKSPEYRNKSHWIELAVRKQLELQGGEA